MSRYLIVIIMKPYTETIGNRIIVRLVKVIVKFASVV